MHQVEDLSSRWYRSRSGAKREACLREGASACGRPGLHPACSAGAQLLKSHARRAAMSVFPRALQTRERHIGGAGGRCGCLQFRGLFPRPAPP